MEKTLLTFSIFLALAFLPGTGHAGSREHGKMMKRLAETLDLSEDQQKQISEIRKKHMGSVKSLGKELKKLKGELITALQVTKKGPEYRTELQEKFTRLQAKKTELSAARFQMALDIRETLNDDQLAKFKGLREAMHAERDGRKHNEE